MRSDNRYLRTDYQQWRMTLSSVMYYMANTAYLCSTILFFKSLPVLPMYVVRRKDDKNRIAVHANSHNHRVDREGEKVLPFNRNPDTGGEGSWRLSTSINGDQRVT